MKVSIKLSKRHPNKAMRFGRFIVTLESQDVELNDAEVKDLENEGPKFWFSVKKLEEKEKPKKERKKKTSKKVS